MDKSLYDINNLRRLALEKQKENKAFFAKLKKQTPKNLDDLVHDIHFKTFDKVDCLICANCCKSISPIVTDKDIARISKVLRKKPSALIDEYFRIDEDNDYVFRQTPCPFLLDDNYCDIYESRPKACREYPHTDRKRFFQILNLTLKNISVCPAVYTVVEELKIKK